MKDFFAKIWKGIKAGFAKAWSWSVAHKAIAITIASTVVVGTTCAIVLPIALHNHKFVDVWSSDATSHWHAAKCKHTDEKGDLGDHVYDNTCDTICNVCGAGRIVSHTFDNDCDPTCNVCTATRNTTHVYAGELTADTTTHYYLCSVCGDKKDEANHAYTLEVANSETLKAAATATTKAQYYKSCVCGAKSDSDYFETDKEVATLTDIQDLSKTYDKVELADPTYVTNSDGVVTFEWYNGTTKLDAKPVNAGTYKVKVIVAESATYVGISDEKTFTITPKVLYNLELHVTYAKTTAFSNVSVPVSAGVVEGDDYKVGIDLLGVTVGEYTIANELLEDIYPEACEDLDNYSIDRDTVKVVVDKRELKGNATYGLIYGQYFVGDSYASGSCPIAYQLKTSHNVFEGDEVYISTTFESRNAGAAVLSQGPFGADFENYTLPENPEDLQIDIKIIPRSMPVPNMIIKEQDGNGHFSYTYPASNGAYGEVVTVEFDIASGATGAYKNEKISNVKFYVGGAETTNYSWGKNTINAFITNGEFSETGTLSVGADFTKGLYSLTLTEGGLYSFTGSENFFTVDAIYNKYGYTIAIDGFTFAADAGTYLVEISKASSIGSSGATVSVEKQTVPFTDENLFDCQQAETKTFTLTEGEILCLKVMGGSESLMNDLNITLPDGSNASFFAMEYALDQSKCNWVYQNIENGVGMPCDYYYMDVCGTSDVYIVLYAITSGDITVTVE